MERSLSGEFKKYIPRGIPKNQPLPDINTGAARVWVGTLIESNHDLFLYGDLVRRYGRRDALFLDELRGEIREVDDREWTLAKRLAEVAGEMLRPVLTRPAELFVGDEPTIEDRIDLLNLLHFAPAQRDIPRKLYDAYNFHFENNPTPPAFEDRRGRDFRRRMLTAIGTSPPQEVNKNELKDFFVREMGIPDNACVAFACLGRMSLEDGIEQLPYLFSQLSKAEIDPDLITESLMNAMKGADDQVYRKLSEILNLHPQIREAVSEAVKESNKLAEEYPKDDYFRVDTRLQSYIIESE